MGKTFKDESFGADGKFRKQRRTHDRRAMTVRNQVQPVFSEPFEEDMNDHEKSEDSEDSEDHRGRS